MNGNNNSHNRIGNWWTMLTWVVVIGLLLGGCGGGSAPRVYRVGILSGLEGFASIADGFKAQMAELGYVEGQNIVYDVQKTNVDMAAYKSISQKFVADKVDLIFVFPTEASLEAKAVTQGTNIPVVFAASFIEGTDLVESVRQPGGNITGVRYPGPDLAAKNLEILREIAPQAKRVWVPYLRGYPSIPGQLEVLRPAAAAAGVTLIEVPAANAAELQADLEARAKSADIGLDAIMTIYEPLALSPDVIALLTEFSAKHKVLFAFDIYNLWIDNVQVGKQAAPLADKILKGIPAGTIPVVSPESLLQINYKRAQELGLTVPEGILKQADEIIR
jgi:putative ABC transport system substrate-binding protein